MISSAILSQPFLEHLTGSLESKERTRSSSGLSSFLASSFFAPGIHLPFNFIFFLRHNAGQHNPFQQLPDFRISFQQMNQIFFKDSFNHTSFPQASHPGVSCLANNSMRGRSPHNSTMRSLTQSGFRECSLIFSIII